MEEYAQIYQKSCISGSSLCKKDAGFRELYRSCENLRKNRFRYRTELIHFQQEKSASELQLWLDMILADHPQSENSITTGRGLARNCSVKLPTNCANCWASVLPSEVEWISSKSVVCSYCGSVISSSN